VVSNNLALSLLAIAPQPQTMDFFKFIKAMFENLVAREGGGRL
jgi:hypothetical protein